MTERSSPDSVQDAMQECVDIAMQYDDCGGEFIAQKIRDRILSLQPATPTACPTSNPSWPESQPCPICGAFGPWFDTPQIGECVEATASDAVAGEAGFSLIASDIAEQRAQVAAALRSPNEAATPTEPLRDALGWLVNCVECEVNLPGTTTVFQLRLAKAKEALAAPAQPVAATPPRYIVDGLPELPDDDADFTPYLARKIIAKYQEILRGAAQAPTAPDVELERDMWIAAAGGEAEIGKREAAKAEALYLLVNEAQAALVEFKRWCRTDISRKSWDALHALEDVLSRPVGPNIPLSDLANDLQQASSVSSTEGK
jgi:hypothetical protein